MDRRIESKNLPDNSYEDTADGNVFQGIRFFLAGFDPSSEHQYATELENNGAFNVRRYDESCTHVIVHRLGYDDPICAAARKDKKTLVSDLWVADSLDMGVLADTTRILYRPVKDLNGIPGSESLCICLTGYQSQDRSDIMRMVEMMGAQFTKPLMASKVTHLICYKFEGDKYKLAKETGLKLANHRWLEDCLKVWALLPEDNYQISGHQLELLEAEAKDSEDDGVGKICLPTPRQSIALGAQVGSPHKALGMCSKLCFHPDEQVPCDKKLDAAKPLPKESPKSKIDGEGNANEKLSSMQSGGSHCSKKCDLGSLLRKNIDANKESSTKDADFKEVVSHEVQGMLNHKVGAGISSVEVKQRDIIGSKVDQEIPTLAVHTPTTIGYARKTPTKFGASNLMKTGSVAVVVGSAQGINLMNEKEEIFNTPSSMAKTTSGGLNQSYDRKFSDRAEPEEREATEVQVKNSLLVNVIEADKQSVNANIPLTISSANAKMQKRQGSLSADCNLGFNKVMWANVEADSPKLDKACDAENLVSPMQTEEMPTKVFVSTSSEFQHWASDHAFNVSNVSPMDCVGGTGKKTAVDLRETELQTSGFETPNGDCQLEASANGKRQKQFKRSGPSKRKRTTQGSHATSTQKTMGSNPTNVNDAEEMDKEELSVEKQSINGGLSEIRTRIGNDFRMPSMVHTSGDSSYKTPNIFTPLKSSPANAASVSSLKVGRKQGINRSGAKRTGRLEFGSGTFKEHEADIMDLDVTAGTGINCNPQAQFAFDGETPDAPQSKPDASESKQVHPFEEGDILVKNSIPKIGNVSINSSEKHCDIAPTKKPQKRGRPPSRKAKSVQLESANPLVEQTKYQDNAESGVIHDEPAETRWASKSIGGSASEIRSSCMVLHKEQISDAAPISAFPNNQSVDLGAPASAEQLHGNSISNSPPDKSNACRWSVNGSVNEHGCTLNHSVNNASLKMLQVARNLQVSKEDERKGSVQTEGAQHFEMETSHTKVDEALQTSKGGNNSKTGVSIGEKSKGGTNVTSIAEMDAPAANEKSVQRMHDGKENTSIPNEAPKVTLGKAANAKSSSKISKRSRAGSHVVASEKVKDVSMSAKLESSKIMVHSEPRWFMLSGHRLQRKEFQQFVKSLGGRLCKDSHQWSYQATHLVVPDPLRRTEKFFAAVAAGRWVLTSDYLTSSKQAGKFLDEHEYEWHKSGLNEDGTISFEAPRKWRLLRENTGYGALHGLRIIVYGECIAPTLDTLKRVVKAGGGLILATCPPYNRFLAAGVDFAIISPGIPRDDIWVQEFLSHNIACVLVDYIVEYVCKPSYPLDKHVLYNTHAAVEKSFKSMHTRIHSAAVTNKAERTPLADAQSESRVEPEDEHKVEEHQAGEISCSVCGSADRDDVMLLCGDDQGRGCGIAVHIDCCQPPLDTVPQEDWFCSECKPPFELKKTQAAKRTKKS